MAKPQLKPIEGRADQKTMKKFCRVTVQQLFNMLAFKFVRYFIPVLPSPPTRTLPHPPSFSKFRLAEYNRLNRRPSSPVFVLRKDRELR
jgi:hypothetical protein